MSDGSGLALLEELYHVIIYYYTDVGVETEDYDVDDLLDRVKDYLNKSFSDD